MKTLIQKIYNTTPVSIKNFLNHFRIKERLLIWRKASRERKKIQDIRDKVSRGEKIRVVFLAMTVSMWKYDKLFLSMLKSSLYEPRILLLPRANDSKEIQNFHFQKMETYFQSKNYPILKTLKDFNDFDADILFYAQPYKNNHSESFRIQNQMDKLTCYVPYAFFISNYSWAYDTLFHNLAWKLFYPSELHRQNARQIAFNRGGNVEVVGYPLADLFFMPPKSNPWKIQDTGKKRIIYAPHHSILENDLANCGTFTRYGESILAFAKEHPEMQFAFKPHPHLREHLYRHPDWGKERTDAYFAAWNEAPNTFLFEGDYIDLFKTSDALIHDCGSFTVEYLFVDKPILYIGNPRDGILCHFGKMAMQANYTLEDFSISEFLKMVVASANSASDFKRGRREWMIQNQLVPPNGKTFAENILDVLNREIFPSDSAK